MLQKKDILLPISKKEVIEILNRHIQNRFIGDTVHEDGFQMHMCVAQTANRAFLTLCIKGTLAECDHGLRVSCTIRPTYLAILCGGVLCATLLDGFFKLCAGVENAPYVLIGLILNLVFQGSIAWQEHICLQRFYNWLTD